MRKVVSYMAKIYTMMTLFFVVSCTNEEETFFFDDNGVPQATSQQRINEEQFLAMVDGNGWVETATHEIYSNGDYDRRDYWEGMEGVGGISRYSLRGDSISEYIFMQHTSVLGHNTRAMRYDPSTNTVYSGDKMVLRIISVNNGWMQAIKSGGMSFRQRSQSKALYFFVTLRKMSDDEKEDIERFNR